MHSLSLNYSVGVTTEVYLLTYLPNTPRPGTMEVFYFLNIDTNLDFFVYYHCLRDQLFTTLSILSLLQPKHLFFAFISPFGNYKSISVINFLCMGVDKMLYTLHVSKVLFYKLAWRKILTHL